jgi:cytidine deaminase
MNLNELYNVALDALTEKKSNGFGFNAYDNSTITVLCTPDNEIFKASNGSIVKDGNLTNTCSEYEAINSMVKANKNKVESLVTLDIETGSFVMPCSNCLDLIMQVNPENAYCNVMVDANESVELHTLLKNDPTVQAPIDSTTLDNNLSLDNFDDWLDGWGDDTSTSSNNTPQESTPQTSTTTPPQTTTNTPTTTKSVQFDDNPIPNKPDSSTKKDVSSYYQSKYLNATPNSISSVVSVNNTTFKRTTDITTQMREKGLTDGDKKDFNKQRLYNAFTVENVLNVNGVQNGGSSSEMAEKQTLTKKELIKLAKEKKKMAKKDAKILEASNKKNGLS